MTLFAQGADTEPLSLFDTVPQKLDKPAALMDAARIIARGYEAGRAISAAKLRSAMITAFGGDDTQGSWIWKDAYEVCEAASVLYLRKYGPAFRQRADDATKFVSLLEDLSALAPSQTRRSEENVAMQQFSTPLGLSGCVFTAAAITSGDTVLEPSAGTGLLAAMAEIAGAKLVLNELADARFELLRHLFPAVRLFKRNAEHIDDFLPDNLIPSVVLMNPPFSVSPGIAARNKNAALTHVRSALARLAVGGRLVAITQEPMTPLNPQWRDAFVELQRSATLVFTAAIGGKAYRRHGTNVETRLLVFDKSPADNAECFVASAGATDKPAELAGWIADRVPARLPCDILDVAPTPKPITIAPRAAKAKPALVKAVGPFAEVVDVEYEAVDWTPDDRALTEAIYEPYALQSIRIATAKPHPSPLVQSAAMAAVAPPKPTHRPKLPRAVVENGLLSNAQLESVIYAGEAHSAFLSGRYVADETFDNLKRVDENHAEAKPYRRGWFLGDGTGAGKGRQVAGVILDNWLNGRRRAIWVSKSSKLLEDARRDWAALGGDPKTIIPHWAFKQGKPIVADDAILFTTYATLRSAARQGKASRLDQILKWVGSEFDGAIMFDEAHAMANAVGDKSERGVKKPSEQGRVGLRLQNALPAARVVYVSATGATNVSNLAYAARLGLWGGEDCAFTKRSEFISAMERGCVAAMEVISRDLKALGLYTARSLSFDGVRYDMLTHDLTDAQKGIYDAYAEAFQVIHQNLDAALEAGGITKGGEALNTQAKASAKSAFESAKQRFFNHLLCAMKTPTLIKAIEGDIAAGSAVLIQIVSTNEALMERRLSTIPASEWNDLNVDITPREYVMDYLMHAFPTTLHQLTSDDEGNVFSVAVTDDQGNPVHCKSAVRVRDELVERLAILPPVPGALDQVIHHFGDEQVEEVTGRSRRIVRRTDAAGERYMVQNRPASANITEAVAYMDDEKPILVFSDAGGTGRSYHADLNAKNQRQRVHYLLEPGWRADNAIQGLGRSNRTNQKQPPLFRPVATDIKGEKRFLSTIARRLDSLDALTRGQRQMGGQGLFRDGDNLESVYARISLLKFYAGLARGALKCCSLSEFMDMTGLALLTPDGSLKRDLPPIPTFLNRLLALPIAMQNAIFEDFEKLLEGEVDAAITGGTYEVGVETLQGHAYEIVDRKDIFKHPKTGAITEAVEIIEKYRNSVLSVEDAIALAEDYDMGFVVNTRSKRAAVITPAPVFMCNDGSVEKRLRLERPLGSTTITETDFEESAWERVGEESFCRVWSEEAADIPEFAERTIHLVTGLLLPIWDRLPQDNMKVNRLQTSDGQRVLGRVVNKTQLKALLVALGHSVAGQIDGKSVVDGVLSEGATFALATGLRIKRSKVMYKDRVEIVGFMPSQVGVLKSLGCIGEIIEHRLRLFIPASEDVSTLMDRILTKYPVVEWDMRKAA